MKKHAVLYQHHLSALDPSSCILGIPESPKELCVTPESVQLSPYHWLPIPVAQTDIRYLKRSTPWWCQVFDLTAKTALICAYQWKQGSSLLSCLPILIFSVSSLPGTFSLFPFFFHPSFLTLPVPFLPLSLHPSLLSYLSLRPAWLSWTHMFFLLSQPLLHL